MNKKSYVVLATVVVTFGLVLGWLRSNVRSVPGLRNADPTIVQGIVLFLGIVVAAVMAWVMSRAEKKSGSQASGAAAEAPAEVTDLDELIAEAEARLSVAQQEKDCKLGRLPAILLLGETGSAKTTTMVHSGAEAESLAGQVYEENNILPTPTANFWFAHHTIFVEMAGKLLGDTSSWKQVIGRLQPAKAAALLGTAEPMPRAALVCVDAEGLTSPSPDALAVSARKLRAQLAEISQLLGINLPVYVLFTRTDRLPFFTEYVSKLNEEEATRIVGVTLPIVPVRQGIYAEQETARIGGVFDNLFRSLCNARPTYLAREGDATQLAGIYEFPREFRKIRGALVRYLVELCRPSQLTVGPFLRGFYFSGVRPILVNEVAPAAPPPQASQAAGGRIGATSIFRAMSGAAAQPAGQRIVGTRKVPQWLFLGHFFNDLLLGDQAAKGASAGSIRASVPRRILLLTAAALCLIYSAALVVSFGRNRALANGVKQASQGIASVDNSGAGVASLDSLQRLEKLRQSLETLTKYNREGAPLSYRWGLYIGNDLYPEVRKLYFADFRRLLLSPTQNVLVDSMRGLPPTPTGPEYGPTYDGLRAYLVTTSNHDKSSSVLPPVLLNRWSANRNVEPERLQLSQKQFEFYSEELKIANPFPGDNDAAAIGRARLYLSLFAGFERVYQAMLADAAKTGPAINFNKRFPGSAEEVIDGQDVASPFTKPGWDFMKASLRNPEKYFAGEPWVLGEQAAANIDRSKLGQQLADRYYADFLKEWRAYLKAAGVVKYASLPDAAKKLGVLSGNQSPLLALFWLASQNTAVDVAAVASAFQPVQTVVPPTSVDRYIAPANQTYMNALVTLQASVDTVAQQPTGNDAAANQTLTNASAAKVAAKQVAQAFRLDPDGHIDAVVEKLMEDPITNVEALLRNLGPAELNGKGKTLCSVYRPVLNKFPFNPSATAQATIADLNGIFHKPDGAFWKFYDENLQKLLPKQGSQYVAATVGGVTLTPGFVAFFNQAAAFAEALYAGGSADPHFTYTLKPAPMEGIQSVTLDLDGQSFSASGSDTTSKQFVWQASGTHGSKASAKFGGTDLGWFPNTEGLWAIFQFFNQADAWRPSGSGNILEWIIRAGKNAMTLPSGKPLTVRFELDMGGSPQVFQKGYFARMACVADVAK